MTLDRSRRLLVELEALLVDPPASDGAVERSQWLEPIVEWVRMPAPTLAGGPSSSTYARLGLLIQTLRARPELAKQLAAVLAGLFGETSAVSLFAETGLGSRPAFWSEAVRRVSRRLLPDAPDDERLDEVVGRLFQGRRAAAWLEGLPADLLEALWTVTFPDPGDRPFGNLRSDLADAVNLLAARASVLGLSADVRARTTDRRVDESPMAWLPRLCLRATDAALEGPSEAPDAAGRAWVDAVKGVEGCRRVLDRVHDHLEEFGVNVDLVFRLELARRTLDRIERLLDVLMVPPDAVPAGAGVRLLGHLVRRAREDRSVVELVRTSARLLSLKIIESASHTGEHYIATTRAEYRAMLRGAAGGGLLTAGTTLVKMLLKHLPLAPFFGGLATSLNYALSFLLIQAFGFNLATKQPSTTAAALAAAISEAAHDVERLVEQIARTTRSQLASIAGNLGVVVPASVLMDLGMRALLGHGALDDEHARQLLASLHPFRSGTIPFAAATGVMLWLSSLAGGWLDNWASYNRVAEAISRSRRLLDLVGESRRSRLASAFERSVSGFGGNVSLGFLLGMVPAVAGFFGVPLDARHVTLSTSSLAYAAAALGPGALLTAPFLWAALGIVFIAVLNFSVSFGLALSVAARARGVTREDHRRLRAALARDVVRSPGRFLLPPRD